MPDLTPAQREQQQAIVEAYVKFGRAVAEALRPSAQAFAVMVQRVEAADRRREAERDARGEGRTRRTNGIAVAGHHKTNCTHRTKED